MRTKTMVPFQQFSGLFFIFSIGLCVGIGSVVLASRPQPHAIVPVPALPVSSSIPISSPPENTSWVSPDGTIALIMKKEPLPKKQTTYSFFTRIPGVPAEHLIFRTTLDSTVRVSIPFNSWSPDNHYFFIQEQDATGIHPLVLKASGEAFADHQISIDVHALFVQKQLGYEFGEATGWAGTTLVIINTNKTDHSGIGPSFWFDISKKSFIRLATTFQ